MTLKVNKNKNSLTCSLSSKVSQAKIPGSLMLRTKASAAK